MPYNTRLNYCVGFDVKDVVLYVTRGLPLS